MALVGTSPATSSRRAAPLRRTPRLAVTVRPSSPRSSCRRRSLGFVLEYWLGGTRADLGHRARAMVGVHVLIGIGEGLITAATVVAVAAVRPDLVYALRGTRPRGLRCAGRRTVPRDDMHLRSWVPARWPARRAGARRRGELLRLPRPRRARRGPLPAAPSTSRLTTPRRHLHRAAATDRWPPARSPATASVADDGRPPASPGSPGSLVHLRWSPWSVVRRRVLRRHGHRRPGDGLTVGAGPRPSAVPCPAAPRCTGCPPRCKIVAMLVVACCVVATPREAFWAFGGTPPSSSPCGGHRPDPARLVLRPRGDRAAVRGVRGAAAVHRHRPAGRGARAVACPSPACSARGTSWPRAPSACWPRSTCWPRPPPPATCSWARPAALPRAGRHHHHVHDPLRRRHHRSPSARRMRVARISAVHDPRFLWQVARRRPRDRARCSCAPTSAANGSTWRCCPRVTPGGCRGARAARDGRGDAPAEWPSRPPRRRRAGRVAIAMVAAWTLSSRTAVLAGRRARSPTPTRTVTRRCTGSTSRRAAGERVALLGPERRRQDDAGAAPQRHPRAPAAGACASAGCRSRSANLAEIRRRVGIVFQDPDDQLFMPTVRDDVAFGPGQPRPAGRRAAARVDEALAAVGMDGAPTARPHHLSFGAAPPGRGGHRAGDATRRSWCSTSRRRTSTRRPGASSPTSCAAST